MDIESANNINNVNIELLNEQVKKIIGDDWVLDVRSAIAKADDNGKISCHIYVTRIGHVREHYSLAPFVIDTQSTLSVNDQLTSKIKELKQIIADAGK